MDISSGLTWVLSSAASLALTAIAALVAKPFLKAWIERRAIEAADHRLERTRSELAKEVETHKSELAIAADRASTRFQKEVTDFAIYAQRRHDAVRDFHGEVVSNRAGAYGTLTVLAEGVTDHLQSLATAARTSVYAVRSSLSKHVLYLPPSIAAQGETVIQSFIDILVAREAGKLSVEVQPFLNGLDSSVSVLTKLCRDELRASTPKE